MSSDLLNSLNNLKSQLGSLEESIFFEQVKTNSSKNSQEKVKNIQGKLKIIEQSQDNIVQVDVRGEMVFLSKQTIHDCALDTILKDHIQYGSNEAIFVDVERSFFNIIVNIMRYYNKSLLDGRTPPNYQIKVSGDTAEDIATLELMEFFKGTEIISKVEFVRK